MWKITRKYISGLFKQGPWGWKTTRKYISGLFKPGPCGWKTNGKYFSGLFKPGPCGRKTTGKYISGLIKPPSPCTGKSPLPASTPTPAKIELFLAKKSHDRMKWERSGICHTNHNIKCLPMGLWLINWALSNNTVNSSEKESGKDPPPLWTTDPGAFFRKTSEQKHFLKLQPWLCLVCNPSGQGWPTRYPC